MRDSRRGVINVLLLVEKFRRGEEVPDESVNFEPLSPAIDIPADSVRRPPSWFHKYPWLNFRYTDGLVEVVVVSPVVVKTSTVECLVHMLCLPNQRFSWLLIGQLSKFWASMPTPGIT